MDQPELTQAADLDDVSAKLWLEGVMAMASDMQSTRYELNSQPCAAG